MNGMNEAILAVAQAQQQGDAIPVDVPPMTQSAPDMGKPPTTPKTKTDTMEEPRLWPEYSASSSKRISSTLRVSCSVR